MRHLSVIITLLLLVGCETENPFIPNEVAEAILNEKKIKPVEHVAIIANNDVYWYRNFSRQSKQLTQSPAVIKKNIRLNHSYTRMAYLNSTGAPVIIDTLGKTVEQPSEFKDVKQMDWSADDRTLYMLIGNELKFHGAPMNVAALEIEPGEVVVSAVVTAGGDVLYIVQTKTGYTYTERLVRRTQTGATTTIENKFAGSAHMANIRLSRDGEHFTLNYKTLIYDSFFSIIEVSSLLTNLREFSYSGRYLEPVYDATSRFLVMAWRDPNDYETEHLLMALYTKLVEYGEEDPDMYTNVSQNPGAIFIDWK